MDKMPGKIWATPRGSGTISGIYVDMPLGDEDRGEHEYIRADLPKEVDLGAVTKAVHSDIFNRTGSKKHTLHSKSIIEATLNHLVALGAIKDKGV